MSLNLTERAKKHEDCRRYECRYLRRILSPLFSSLKVIEGKTQIAVCRDPDDDKFLECAVDAKALYIVSGDNDLLDIKAYDGIQIITAKEFCEKYL
ncbi:MAG: putative toxin-antitoxin system toxin component, PIN family [Lachnospiraceae bacterium]|nr:putative toxin-antitoxin system toxin component, PIN family [Lachnospiraceae bacterium]